MDGACGVGRALISALGPMKRRPHPLRLTTLLPASAGSDRAWRDTMKLGITTPPGLELLHVDDRQVHAFESLEERLLRTCGLLLRLTVRHATVAASLRPHPHRLTRPWVQRTQSLWPIPRETRRRVGFLGAGPINELGLDSGVWTFKTQWSLMRVRPVSRQE